MNEELLLKYITGQATEGEKIRILNWLEEHPDNRLKFNRLKNTWVISKLPETKAPEASVLQYSRKIRPFKLLKKVFIVMNPKTPLTKPANPGLWHCRFIDPASFLSNIPSIQ